MGYGNNRLGGLQRYDENGAAQVTSLIAMFRDDFNGSALDANNWTPTVGVGATVTVAGGALSITAGTTANAETVVLGKLGFTVPFRVWFIARLSQRIANQEFYLEVVDSSGTMVARHLIDGTTATTAKYDSFNGGNSSGAVTNTGYLTSASDSIYEIQLFPDEAWFFNRGVDSGASARGVNGVKNRNVPDPNATYYIRVRAKNLAVAPASNTTLTLDAICAQDINELTAELTGGQGDSSPAKALGVLLAGTATVAGTVTSNSSNTFYNDTTTALAASGTFTGTARDFGVSPQVGRKVFSVNGFADQAGTLFVDMSNDNVTWRQAKKGTCLAGDSVDLNVAVVTRYYRVRWVNGATAQTALMINSSVQSV